MIEKNSPEWELWKQAYAVKAELSPPPAYSESDGYWEKVRSLANECYDAYKDTSLKVLAEHLFLGIILQLEQESRAKEEVA